jgi:hypothetical protein
MFDNHEGRTSQNMGAHRHQQYQHLRALYSIRGQRLGRQTQPRNTQGRLAAQHPHNNLPGLTVGPPLHRQICHAGQQAAASLQYPMARPVRRSSGLPTSARQTLDVGNQLVHPPVDALARLGSSKSYANKAPRRQSSHRTGSPSSGTNY